MSGQIAVRPPRQARTRQSWDRVLEEGVALLEHEGYAGLTIGALCERAGVTPPSIYARAGNKEQLLLAIYDRAMERIRNADRLDPADRRWPRLGPAATARAAVAEVARLWLAHAPVLRPIVHRSVTDAEVRRRGSFHSRDLGARFREVLLTHRAALPADAEAAADACFRVVYAACVERVMWGPDFESELAVDDATFVTTLGDVAVRYLGLTEEGT